MANKNGKGSIRRIKITVLRERIVRERKVMQIEETIEGEGTEGSNVQELNNILEKAKRSGKYIPNNQLIEAPKKKIERM